MRCHPVVRASADEVGHNSVHQTHLRERVRHWWESDGWVMEEKKQKQSSLGKSTITLKDPETKMQFISGTAHRARLQG